jgi:multiple sugar transport system substrate-binding protein
MLCSLTNDVNPAKGEALRGMTWDHPRGYDPLLACSAAWQERTGVRVEWERRSLQDFESFPVAQLAERYDLIVIDHPHVGQITREQCLVPLDNGMDHLASLGRDYVGASLASYVWEGRLWALPIDAAAQVQAWRPDRLASPPTEWRLMLQLAAAGEVLCPLRPPHDLMALFTLSGLSGSPARVNGPELLAPAAAIAYELLRELTALLDPVCLAMDPIAVLERMSQPDSRCIASPLIYGYVSYSHPGGTVGRAAVAFGDLLPLTTGSRPIGSALGGTGIAVSARSPQRQAAIDFAYWVAGREAQRGPYLAGGGQPASAAAWEDAAANNAALDFYRNTRATLEGAWLRPRHAGYMQFQHAASERLRRALESGESARTVLGAINRLFDGVPA